MGMRGQGENVETEVVTCPGRIYGRERHHSRGGDVSRPVRGFVKGWKEVDGREREDKERA